MRYDNLTILGLLATAAIGCAEPAPRVVVVSIDGLWARDLEVADSAGVSLPILDSLRRTGTLADGVVGSLPSVTYPSHTTMVTGVPPALHGIYSNVRPYDPTDTTHAARAWYLEASRIAVPTLADAAHAAALTVATAGWPVTADDPAIALNLPEVWDTRPSGTSQLALMRRRGTPWLLDSLGAPTGGDFPDSLRATYAADIIRRWDPDLLFMHLVALDGAKHASGPVGEAVWTALRNADRYLGWVVAALQETNAGRSTTVIVTSDHGFLSVRRVLKPGVLLARAGLVRTTTAGHVVGWDAAVVASGGTAAFIPRDDGDSTVTRRIRQAIPDALVGPDRPIRAVWPRDTIAALGGDPRAPWMIDMNDTFYTTIGYGDPLFLERGGGGHGFDPRHPGMYAFFLATGPGIQPDSRMPLIKQEDIAATVARRLGIELPNIVGRPAL